MDDGAKGFVKGLGTGLVGVLAKPISGVAALASKTAEGIASDAKKVVGSRARLQLRVRQPRVALTARHVQRRLLAPVRHVHRGARLDQQLRDVSAALVAGGIGWCSDLKRSLMAASFGVTISQTKTAKPLSASSPRFGKNWPRKQAVTPLHIANVF